jgi:hypothetical protein
MQIIAARFDGSAFSRGGVSLPSRQAAWRTIRELVQNGLTIAFSSLPNISNFDEWDTLNVLQDEVEVDLSAAPGTLRSDRPLVCIFGYPDKNISFLVAQSLIKQYEEALEERRANDLASRVARCLREDVTFRTTGVLPVMQERHWLSVEAVVALKRFFQRASCKISDRLKANPKFPEEGLTSELVYTALTERDSVDFISALLQPTAARLSLSCSESGSAERILGSDIGFCLFVDGPGLRLRRGILCQAKRLHPDGPRFSRKSRYGDLLDSHGVDQANKMLSITPCSYFLLYNPSDVNAIVGQTSGALELKSSLDYCDDGVLILPASFVAGASKQNFQPVAHLSPFTCSFVKFMVDDFIQGKLGDSSRTALCACLTRELRDVHEMASLDVPPPRFSVTFALEVAEFHNVPVG